MAVAQTAVAAAMAMAAAATAATVSVAAEAMVKAVLGGPGAATGVATAVPVTAEEGF